MRFNQLLQLAVVITGAHIRRIRHHRIELHRQYLRLPHQGQQILRRRAGVEVVAGGREFQGFGQGGEQGGEAGGDLDEGAEGFGVGEEVD